MEITTSLIIQIVVLILYIISFFPELVEQKRSIIWCVLIMLFLILWNSGN